MQTTYIFVCVMVLLTGCKKESVTNIDSSKSYPITVDFQTGFDKDSAVILLDGKSVASFESVTTDPIIVLAASGKFTLTPGAHTLSVELPKDHFRSDTTFTQEEKDVWVSINYNREQRKILYNFQYSPFQYK